VDTLDRRARSEDLYIDVPGEHFTISKYSRDPSSGIRLIHEDYLTAVSCGKREDWVQWLIESLGVSDIPRLLKGNDITPEFKFLVKHKIMDLLHILKNYWCRYHPVFAGRRGKLLCKYLSTAGVKCQDGAQHALNECLLPRTILKRDASYLPYVDIEDPDDSTWLEFDIFGVITRPDWKFYIRRLEMLQGTTTAPGYLPDIKKIYELLQNKCLGNENSIK